MVRNNILILGKLPKNYNKIHHNSLIKSQRIFLPNISQNSFFSKISAKSTQNNPKKSNSLIKSNRKRKNSKSKFNKTFFRKKYSRSVWQRNLNLNTKLPSVSKLEKLYLINNIKCPKSSHFCSKSHLIGKIKKNIFN